MYVSSRIKSWKVGWERNILCFCSVVLPMIMRLLTCFRGALDEDEEPAPIQLLSVKGAPSTMSSNEPRVKISKVPQYLSWKRFRSARMWPRTWSPRALLWASWNLSRLANALPTPWARSSFSQLLGWLWSLREWESAGRVEKREAVDIWSGVPRGPRRQQWSQQSSFFDFFFSSQVASSSDDHFLFSIAIGLHLHNPTPYRIQNTH